MANRQTKAQKLCALDHRIPPYPNKCPFRCLVLFFARSKNHVCCLVTNHRLFHFFISDDIGLCLLLDGLDVGAQFGASGNAMLVHNFALQGMQ
jgi:hypothetical protein